MKKILLIAVLVVVAYMMTGCSAGIMEPDYTTAEFEAALNAGENVTGKFVEVEVRDFKPNSAFGYNLIAGEHLNFVSSDHPDVEVGDTIVVEVEKAASLMGSWIITYKK